MVGGDAMVGYDQIIQRRPGRFWQRRIEDKGYFLSMET
jgi:hypothetical protein